MSDRETGQAAVVVTLPAQIDVTSQDQVYDRLYAAFAADAPVVVADFTGTAFCDCAALRRVVQVRHRAAARGAGFRLVAPPGSLVRRLAALMEIGQVLPVYSTVPEAVTPEPAASLAAGPARGLAGPAGPGADVIVLLRASRLEIARWQAQLGELLRHVPAADPDLAATWDTVAALIDLHMRAEEEICGPALCRAAPRGALARQIRDVHADIREVIAETCLQRPGSPRWQGLAATALSAWDRHCDEEEHGPAAAWLRRADPEQRQLLARQWRPFREARIRDLCPDARPRAATCELRLSQPVTPRLADPCFGPLSCTCQACTARLSQISLAPEER